MGMQGRTNFTNYVLFLAGATIHKDSEVIAQNGARATVLKYGTVMAQIAASRKWVPLTDVAAVDGSNVARGVYIGEDIAAATLVAGDVANCPIVVLGHGGCIADASQLVLENSLTLNSVCSDDPAGADNGVVNVRRIEDDLIRIGITTVGTYDIDLLENS